MSAPSSRRTIRCAIYTRKSSEEGLDQDFNSLDAQYEACAAYVASQKHEGWALAPERYDDGGVSGGTLDRSGLQRLLAEIDGGAIQMIVVYKIDRLTRSLSDFARLIERLEAAGCSFVSVTQAFNTSTSMGRLTLNVLLSFAQFEREVTAERIRDKLAASKKKGMWMGGLTPIGYDARDRALHVNADEARIVKDIFTLYREHKSVARVEEILIARGERSKRHTFKSGRMLGGVPFSRGSIYHLLSNPIYVGQIRHRDALYPGRHKAIIDQALWDEVQALIASNTKGAQSRPRTSSPAAASAAVSPLAGKITDETGDRLTPSHTSKSGRRYRYYVSSRLLTGRAAPGEGWRLPAGELERAVSGCVADMLGHPHAASRILAGTSAASFSVAAARLKSLADAIGGERRCELLSCLAAHITVAPGRLSILLDPAGLADHLDVAASDINADAIAFETEFTSRKRGAETRLCLANPAARPDPILIRTIIKAHAWWNALRAGTAMIDIARNEGLSQRRIASHINLAFLAPDITEAIMNGRQPASLTAQTLLSMALPFDWDEQRNALRAM